MRIKSVGVAIGLTFGLATVLAGAVRPVVSLADAHRGLMGRSEQEQLVICDLGMPRDVDPAIAGLRIAAST